MRVFFTPIWSFYPIWLHRAQPVPMTVPPRETRSATAVVTNYETQVHIASAARRFGQGKLTVMNARAKHMQARTPGYLP